MNYIGDYVEDDIVYLMFNTFSSDDPSASCTISDFINTDVHVYKDDGLTQRNNAAGITVSVDFDGITGSHMIKIDTSDETVAGFWVTGHDYFVRIEGTTVDAATINAMVGSFSIENRYMRGTNSANTTVPDAAGVAPTAVEIRTEMEGVGTKLTLTLGDTGELQTNQGNWVTATGFSVPNEYDTQFDDLEESVGKLTSGTAAVNTTAESFTKSGAEPETNTYTSTATLDGTVHKVEDVAGATDAYYEFDVGGNGIPVSVQWEGYAQSQGDSYAIYAYNYSTPGYEQIGTIIGANGTTITKELFSLTIAQVGTGTDLGKVRFRFLSADGTAFGTDRLLCSYAIVTKSIGYSNGCIWIDTNASNTNTEAYVDGTADNPVSTWAAAKSLATTLGMTNFTIINGSSITLNSDCTNYTFVGCDYTLALGGQVIENTYINGGHVSGTGTCGVGAAHFDNCQMNTCTLGKALFTRCGFDGIITASAATTYIFDGCYSAADGLTPPSFDFGGAVGNTHVGGRNWHGGVEIRNLGAAGVDVFSMTGTGKIKIASTCVGGTIKVFGNINIEDNVGGGFAGTLNDDARIDVDQINVECDTALSDYGANTVVPDAAGVVPTAVEVRQEIDANSTRLDANISSRSTVTTAEVNAEVVDVVRTDVTSEMGQIAPPATPTMEEMMAYIYFRLRNKCTTTADEDAMWDDLGTTKLVKATITDDGTTLTKGEYVSGAP